MFGEVGLLENNAPVTPTTVHSRYMAELETPALAVRYVFVTRLLFLFGPFFRHALRLSCIVVSGARKRWSAIIQCPFVDMLHHMYDV